ncbi:helix-turn-helix transcriptional regulator [Streptomyces sp. NPDC047999]|uniref:helix-turn-helix transcriptional regulator n=1 Tax=Streptomyces sp. NPDC047999 TaxID=3365497 RepID=UPI003724A17B
MMARGLADFDPQALYLHRATRVDPNGNPAPLSAARLGELVGASKAQILAYENGHRTPDPARIRELAEHLGVRSIDLMKQSNQESWDLADWRRASGLTAKELCERLGISPKSYRRLEQQGIVPARRPRFLDDVAQALGMRSAKLDRAISNIPDVIERRRETTAIVKQLAETYIHRPGRWRGPDLDDPGLVRLSVLYGRPGQRIRRILAKVLGELRLMAARREREQIIADFDPEPSRQLKAAQAARQWEEVYHSEMARIPSLLEGFHRSAQPPDSWQALVALSEAEPRGAWVPSTLLGRPETLLQLPPSMVTQQRFGDLEAAQLTPTGARHVSSYQDFYTALYPGLRRPRPRPTRRSGSSGWPSTVFTIPGQLERFTVPAHALERLVLRSTGTGPWDIWLSPTLRLTINHGAGRPTATAHEDRPDGKTWPPEQDPVALAARQSHPTTTQEPANEQ